MKYSGKRHPVLRLIAQGEGLHLDFKFEISDAPKIARSLSAFANTDGGTLLIGVKDNGKISGIRSEEEFYMIQNAAMRYCKPEVSFQSKEWLVEGKKVLEITIPKGSRQPYKASDKQGRYRAYIRVNDENILADGVQMKIWQRLKSHKEIRFMNSVEERNLLQCLDADEMLALSFLKKQCGLSSYKVEKLLSEFVLLGLVEMKTTTEDSFFSLCALPS